MTPKLLSLVLRLPWFDLLMWLTQSSSGVIEPKQKTPVEASFFFVAFVWLVVTCSSCNHFRNTCALTHRPFSQSPSLPPKSSSTLLFSVQSSATQLVAWSRVGVVALFVCQTFCSVLDTRKECIPLYTRHNGASHGEPQARPTARRQSRAWCP